MGLFYDGAQGYRYGDTIGYMCEGADAVTAVDAEGAPGRAASEPYILTISGTAHVPTRWPHTSASWRTLAAKAEGEYGSHDRFCLVSGKCPEPESEQEARGPARKRAKKELAWARRTEWACNPHLNPMCFVNAAVHPGDANVALSDAGGLYFEAADRREGVVPQGWLRLCYGEGYWVLPVGDARSPTGARVSFPELSAQQRAGHLAALGPQE